MVRLDENLSAAGEAIAEHNLAESDTAEDLVEEIELPPFELPPCNLYSDEPPLETDFHRNQIDLLIRLLKHWWQDRQDFYISGNLTVYYNKLKTCGECQSITGSTQRH